MKSLFTNIFYLSTSMIVAIGFFQFLTALSRIFLGEDNCDGPALSLARALCIPLATRTDYIIAFAGSALLGIAMSRVLIAIALKK